MSTDTVPPIPDEFACLFAAATLTNERLAGPNGPTVGQEPVILVTPFPPKSWLYTSDPDGWSFSTESWSLTLRPTLIEDDELHEEDAGVMWRLVFDDDSGAAPIYVSTATGCALLAGNPDAIERP